MKGRRYRAPRAAAQKISDSNRTIIGNAGSAGSAKRAYQVWRGSNRFFLGGRLIFGPDARSLLLTVFLIVTPVILFAVFVSQRLVNEFKNDLGNLIVGIAIVLALYDLFLLFLTSGRDPGIVPRSAYPPEPEDDGCSSRTSTNVSIDWTGPHGVAPSLPPTKDILVNGIIVRVKYCHTCMLYRPPRCSHCSICNNCVERFDHHCPWVGQCIGKRNYRFFFMFVSSTTVLCLYVFAFCCVNLKKITVAYHCTLWGALLKSPVSGILIIYTFITVWFVGGLTFFHLYLVSTNQTTYENFRYRYDRKMNPFNRGCVLNIKEIFFSRVPKSKNNFRAMVRNDSAAFTASLSLDSVMSPDLSKTSLDLEMGGKRHGVAEEDFEDLHNQIGSVSGLEQCGTLPRHSSRGRDATADLEMLAAEFGWNMDLPAEKRFPGKKSLK